MIVNWTVVATVDWVAANGKISHVVTANIEAETQYKAARALLALFARKTINWHAKRLACQDTFGQDEPPLGESLDRDFFLQKASVVSKNAHMEKVPQEEESWVMSVSDGRGGVLGTMALAVRHVHKGRIEARTIDMPAKESKKLLAVDMSGLDDLAEEKANGF